MLGEQTSPRHRVRFVRDVLRSGPPISPSWARRPVSARPVRLIDCGSTATVSCHPRDTYAEMTYDNEFAHRIREQLADERGLTEKAMFGGLAFLLDGNMAVGISNSGELMVRVGLDFSKVTRLQGCLQRA